MAVTLLGTGHVFNLRERVQAEIHRRVPTVVALELDPARYAALGRPRDPRVKAPVVYRMLADFQTRIASEYGVQAGDEMLAASDAARDVGASVALIDRDAQETFRRLLKEMGFVEKARLLGSALASLFLPGKSVDEQVKAMESDYGRFFREMERSYPTLKRVLIDERNEHMARAIREIHGSHPDLVAVMGDGHVDGVVEILAQEGVAVEVVRLKDLRAETAETVEGNASASFSYEWRS